MARGRGNGLLGITNLDPHIYSKEELERIHQQRRDRHKKFKDAREATRPRSAE